MTRIRHLEQLESLKLPKRGYAIFGSGPLAVRGLRENGDLDILLSHDLWDSLASSYPVTSKKERPDSIYIGDLQFLRYDYKDWSPQLPDAGILISDAELIDGHPYVRLEYLLICKRLMTGEKHQRDAGIIESFLASRSRK